MGREGQRPPNYIRNRTCAAPGCADPYFSTGVCAKHYQWRRRNPGQPLPGPRVEPLLDARLAFRLTSAELQLVEQFAAANDSNPSEVARVATLAHVSAHQVVGGPPAPKATTRSRKDAKR